MIGAIKVRWQTRVHAFTARWSQVHLEGGRDREGVLRTACGKPLERRPGLEEVETAVTCKHCAGGYRPLPAFGARFKSGRGDKRILQAEIKLALVRFLAGGGLIETLPPAGAVSADVDCARPIDYHGECGGRVGRRAG